MAGLGRQGSAGFYKAFYNWTRLNTATHGRRYLSNSAVTATATATPDTPPSAQKVLRSHYHVPVKTAQALLANDNFHLNRIQQESGARIVAQPPPIGFSGRWHISMIGTGDTVSHCKSLLRPVVQGEAQWLGIEAADANQPRPSPRLKELYERENEKAARAAGKSAPEHVNTQVRNVMRRAVNNVVVLVSDWLSSTDKSVSASESGTASPLKYSTLRGMTVSSFNSVTMDPEPIISFNVKAPSRTLDCILASKLFTAHFITSTAKGAAFAQTFTKPHEDPSHAFRQLLHTGLVQAITRDPETGPRIVGSPIAAHMTCSVLPEKTVKIGDHLVIFAKAESVASFQIAEKASFLAYNHGSYRALYGAPVVPSDLHISPASRRAVPDANPEEDDQWLTQEPDDSQHKPEPEGTGSPQSRQLKPNPFALPRGETSSKPNRGLNTQRTPNPFQLKDRTLADDFTKTSSHPAEAGSGSLKTKDELSGDSPHSVAVENADATPMEDLTEAYYRAAEADGLELPSQNQANSAAEKGRNIADSK